MCMRTGGGLETEIAPPFQGFSLWRHVPGLCPRCGLTLGFVAPPFQGSNGLQNNKKGQRISPLPLLIAIRSAEIGMMKPFGG